MRGAPLLAQALLGEVPKAAGRRAPHDMYQLICSAVDAKSAHQGHFHQLSRLSPANLECMLVVATPPDTITVGFPSCCKMHISSPWHILWHAPAGLAPLPCSVPQRHSSMTKVSSNSQHQPAGPLGIPVVAAHLAAHESGWQGCAGSFWAHEKHREARGTAQQRSRQPFHMETRWCG